MNPLIKTIEESEKEFKDLIERMTFDHAIPVEDYDRLESFHKQQTIKLLEEMRMVVKKLERIPRDNVNNSFYNEALFDTDFFIEDALIELKR